MSLFDHFFCSRSCAAFLFSAHQISARALMYIFPYSGSGSEPAVYRSMARGGRSYELCLTSRTWHAMAEAAVKEEAELPLLNLDLETFLSDTSRSCSVQSSVSEWAKTEECCMGIDEAGRGPVLGTAIGRNSVRSTLTIVGVYSLQDQWCMEHVSVQCQR